MAQLAMPLPMKEIEAFCKKHGIVRLCVFGSIVRDDFHEGSDVDFLATFGESARQKRPDRESRERELAEIVGREIDLIDSVNVVHQRNVYRRDRILNSCEEIYVEE